MRKDDARGFQVLLSDMFDFLVPTYHVYPCTAHSVVSPPEFCENNACVRFLPRKEERKSHPYTLPWPLRTNSLYKHNRNPLAEAPTWQTSQTLHTVPLYRLWYLTLQNWHAELAEPA